MSTTTTNLGLFKYDTNTDGHLAFNINRALNENWDKIDNVVIDLNGKADIDLSNISNAGNIKIAHNAMPSNIYIGLILGASGSTYTAPADGWFNIEGQLPVGSTAMIEEQTVHAITSVGIHVVSHSARSSNTVAVSIPCRRNDFVSIYYDFYKLISFGFIYAQGSISEANQ